MNRKLKIGSMIILFLLIGTIAVQAVTISKETIKKNLEGYSLTGKVASAVVGNSKYTVGGDSAKIGNVAVTDDTISFVSSNTPFIYKYKVEGNVCTFLSETDLTKETTMDEYLSQTLKINLLSACFLAVTDSYQVDSNNALYYYMDKIEKTKLNVNYNEINNQDYLALGKRYVETIGRVDDKVMNQYIRIISNTETNCKYETVLEIKLDQITNISVDRPATNSSPITNPNENIPVRSPENDLVPVNTQSANYVGTNRLTEMENGIGNDVIGAVTNQIDETPDSRASVGQSSQKEADNTGLKIIIVIIIIALVAVAIVRYEKVRKEK